MTLDEAIKHCEDVEQEKRYEYQECLAVYDIENAEECGRCGEEHRQLAEWLKDYKRLLEQKPKTGRWIFDEILDKHYYCSECKSMGVNYWDFCPNCGAKMVEPQESENKK